jgi:hypothetical protein
MSRITRLLLCLLAVGLAVPLVSAATPARSAAARTLIVTSGTLAATRTPAAASRTPAAASRTLHPLVGIGDDKPDMFSDPRFLALGIRIVRYDMSWDALSVPYQRAEVTAWMDAAKRRGLVVLVTIDHSDRVIYKKVKVDGRTRRKAFSQTRVLPTEAQYVSAFRAFRRRFPWVREFATWDETNYYGEATYDREALVASYYRGLRSACASCTILAAEFLDVAPHEAVPMKTWAAAFIKALGYQPGFWGLNNYEDANHLRSTSTRELLAAVHGDIWLAETGGIVARPHVTNPGFPQNTSHAAKVDAYVLDTLGSLSPRIQRIYLYEWDAKTPRDSWDTALISYTGVPRPGYDVLANALDAWGIRPKCAISTVPPACAGSKAKGPTAASGTGGSSGSSGGAGATGTAGSGGSAR